MVRDIRAMMASKKKETVDRLDKTFKQVQQNLEKKKTEVLQEIDKIFSTLDNKVGKDMELPADTRTNIRIWKSE